MSVCTGSGIKDFPIQNNVRVTDALNKSIEDNLLLETKFGLRSTPPEFMDSNKAFLNEGIYGQASQTSTLRLQGAEFSLLTVQIVKPIHVGLLTEANQRIVQGEILLVFKNNSTNGENYCFLCIPLLEKSTMNPSSYLEALRRNVLPNAPVGFDSLLPASREFVSYVTCISRTEQATCIAVQARVLFFYPGLEYDASKIRELRNSYFTTSITVNKRTTNIKQGQLAFPESSLPDNLTAKRSAAAFRISTEEEYKQYLISSKLLTPSQTSVSGNRRIDNTNAYQCVPLLPDDTVRNGQIVVDTDTGVPLSQVLKEKTAEDNETMGKGEITPGDVEKIVAISVGSIIGIIFLGVVAYMFTLLTSENAGPAFPWLKQQTMAWLPTAFIGIATGIVGFLIGMFAM